jgi:hypothetical protein
MICLAVAGISNLWLRRSTHVPENLADALTGFLYGISIATMLIGIWRRGRRASDGGSCA